MESGSGLEGLQMRMSSSSNNSSLTGEQKIKKLRKMHKKLTQGCDPARPFAAPPEMQPGAVVKWKRDLKINKLPEYDQYAVVMEREDENIQLHCKNGFVQLSVKLGFMAANTFLMYWFDGRAFEVTDDVTNVVRDLKKKRELYLRDHKYTPGDIVTAKCKEFVVLGMAKYGQPMIVVSVHPRALHANTTKPGTPTFREPAELQVAYVDGNGDTICRALDSHRVMKWEEYKEDTKKSGDSDSEDDQD